MCARTRAVAIYPILTKNLSKKLKSAAEPNYCLKNRDLQRHPKIAHILPNGKLKDHEFTEGSNYTYSTNPRRTDSKSLIIENVNCHISEINPTIRNRNPRHSETTNKNRQISNLSPNLACQRFSSLSILQNRYNRRDIQITNL